MDKVLVLGVNGFVGRHFQDYIRKNSLLQDFSFIGIDKKIEELINIRYKEIDLLECRSFERLLLREKPDYIINLSGVFNGRLEMMSEVNAGISRDMFEIIAKNKLPVKNILLIGSAAEYGPNKDLPLSERAPLNPLTPYGLSKAVQTLYAIYYFNNFGISVNIARTFNLAGRNISELLSLGSFVKQIKEAGQEGVIYVGNLNTKRDFLDVSDAVCAYWKILLKGRKGEVYNVSCGRAYYMKEILDFLLEKSKKKLNIFIKKEYLRNNDILQSCGDNAKLKQDTGWQEESSVFNALTDMLGE